jgi:hypothetical protein
MGGSRSRTAGPETLRGWSMVGGCNGDGFTAGAPTLPASLENQVSPPARPTACDHWIVHKAAAVLLHDRCNQSQATRARRRAGATANGFRPPCPVNVLFGVDASLNDPGMISIIRLKLHRFSGRRTRTRAFDPLIKSQLLQRLNVPEEMPLSL